MRMNNEGKLLLSKELYDKSIILSAVQQYHKLAMIKVHEKGNYWECVFTECNYDRRITMREFENYVIDMTNVRTR